MLWAVLVSEEVRMMGRLTISAERPIVYQFLYCSLTLDQRVEGVTACVSCHWGKCATTVKSAHHRQVWYN